MAGDYSVVCFYLPRPLIPGRSCVLPYTATGMYPSAPLSQVVSQTMSNANLNRPCGRLFVSLAAVAVQTAFSVPCLFSNLCPLCFFCTCLRAKQPDADVSLQGLLKNQRSSGFV
jgi:hypothetical protein